MFPSLTLTGRNLSIGGPCTARMRVTHVESKQQWDELLEAKKSTPVTPIIAFFVNNLP